MDTETADRYTARCFFQRDLDDAFPQGAVCAVLPVREGRVRPGGWVEITGRVMCSDARSTQLQDQWAYEVLIDTRTKPDEPREEYRLWIKALAAHPTADGLWESPIDQDGPEQLLRLNANVSGGVRSTRARRAAVTEAHERSLFPEGMRS